jgi:hypothetical protein
MFVIISLEYHRFQDYCPFGQINLFPFFLHGKLSKKLEGVNLYEKFSAETEFCKIDPWSG